MSDLAAFTANNFVKGGHLSTDAPIKMSLLAVRAAGLSDAEWHEEYRIKHGALTKAAAEKVPILRAYTQATPLTAAEREGFPIPAAAQAGTEFDALTTIGWSGLAPLWGSFQQPEYKASAGQHKFSEDNKAVGVLTSVYGEVKFQPDAFKARKDAVIVGVLLAASDNFDQESSQFEEDLKKRLANYTEAGKGTGLLRYVLNKGIVLNEPEKYFAGTQFEAADWKSTAALDQLWFKDAASAVEFFKSDAIKALLRDVGVSFNLQNSKVFVGHEFPVVAKDEDF